MMHCVAHFFTRIRRQTGALVQDNLNNIRYLDDKQCPHPNSVYIGTIYHIYSNSL